MEENNKVEKVSYEELNNTATQLAVQNNQLRMKLQECNMYNAFKRLDYLFKVIENKDSFNKTFLDKCIKEVEDIMTPEDNKENNDKA